jgi:hypothetical protein
MRLPACTFHNLIKKHFNSATIDGKPWLTMYDDRGVQHWLLMFGPEALNVIPALITYAASKAKDIVLPEVEEAFEAFIADIASTGHIMAAEGVRLWTEAKTLELQAEHIASASVFQATTWSAEMQQGILTRIREKLTQAAPENA